MMKGFHHVGVICQDIEKSKEFFTKVLGGKLLYDAGISAPGYLDKRVGIAGAIARKAVVQVGDSTLELVEYRHPNPENYQPQGSARSIWPSKLTRSIQKSRSCSKKESSSIHLLPS